MRRRPVQGRSSGALPQTSRAASALPGRVPLEDITTSRIAVEAGVSVGALYRFFLDKQAIIDGIAVERADEFRVLRAQDGMLLGFVQNLDS